MMTLSENSPQWITNHPKYMRSNFMSKHLRRGFSLIELLVVVAIIAGMATLSIPALSSLKSSGQINQTVLDLSGLLEQARQYAIAQNTYVWVAFYPTTNSTTGVAELSVVALASKDGMDPSPWSTYDMTTNTDIIPISKIKTYRQVQLGEAGSFTSAEVQSLPANPAVSSSNSLSNNKAIFSLKIPSYGTSSLFSRVIQFTPSGEARNSASPINVVEFALQPQKGNAAFDRDNAVVVRVNGLTGQTCVYRR